MSIALKHKQRCLEQLGKTDTAAVNVAPLRTQQIKGIAGASKGYELAIAKLDQDLVKLKETSDIAQRAQLKRALLPDYLAYLESYKNAGANHPNQVLVHMVIWLLDVEDLANAIELADLAIEQQQLMPDRFKRDLTTFVVESVAEWAERQLKESHSPEPYLGDVISRIGSHQWIVEQIIVGGKIYKIAGLSAEQEGHNQLALGYYKSAMAINSKAGVKTRIQELEKKLLSAKPQEPAAAPAVDPAAQTDTTETTETPETADAANTASGTE